MIKTAAVFRIVTFLLGLQKVCKSWPVVRDLTLPISVFQKKKLKYCTRICFEIKKKLPFILLYCSFYLSKKMGSCQLEVYLELYIRKSYMFLINRRISCTALVALG